MKTITVLVGSLRQDSMNRALARALEVAGKDRFRFVYADLAPLPMYNDDLWADVPDAVTALKQQLAETDGVLFVTPEYNRSIPPVLSNAIAWASKPYGENSWAGLPAAVAGTSPGPVGAAGAQIHLKSMLPVLDMLVFGQPELYVQGSADMFDDTLGTTREDTRVFFEDWAAKFDAFLDRVARQDTRIAAE